MPIELTTVTSGYNLSVINDNFQTIEDSWDEKVDRLVSTQDNQMEQELDMNSNSILNLPAPATDLEPVRLRDINDLIFVSGAEGVIPFLQPRQTGDGSTTVFSAPNAEVVPAYTMFVNIDGVTQRPLTDYDVTAANTITFTEAPPLDSSIDVTYFEPQVVNTDAATGSFTAASGETITVVNGLITSIA